MHTQMVKHVKTGRIGQVLPSAMAPDAKQPCDVDYRRVVFPPIGKECTKNKNNGVILVIHKSKLVDHDEDVKVIKR